MNRTWTVLLPVLLAIPLALMTSCATLSKEQCQTANWTDIGFQDGSHGYATTRLGEHMKSCSEYGVSPNSKAYDAGYQQGLRTYCTPQTGFELGKMGTLSMVTCPADLVAAFNQAIERGKLAHQQELAAQELLKKAREGEEKRRTYFSPEPRGGLCDAANTSGLCYVFSGPQHRDTKNQQANRMACNILQGVFRTSGQCNQGNQVGRCHIAKGGPNEIFLYYYQVNNLTSLTAQQDCRDPKSNLHNLGAGEWSPVP